MDWSIKDSGNIALKVVMEKLSTQTLLSLKACSWKVKEIGLVDYIFQMEISSMLYGLMICSMVKINSPNIIN